MARGAAGGIQRLMQFFLPKEEEFFGLFEHMAERAYQGALLLQELFHGGRSAEALQGPIMDLEHEVDDLKHECINRLNNTFVTPIMFDRQDILDLADELDSVVDFTRAAVDRTALYKVTTVPPAVAEMSDILVAATSAMHAAAGSLAKLRSAETTFVAEVNALENRADSVLKQGLAELFANEKDAITILKWKEILDYVEEAIDHCEDTVNTIEAALVKNS